MAFARGAVGVVVGLVVAVALPRDARADFCDDVYPKYVYCESHSSTTDLLPCDVGGLGGESNPFQLTSATAEITFFQPSGDVNNRESITVSCTSVTWEAGMGPVLDSTTMKHFYLWFEDTQRPEEAATMSNDFHAIECRDSQNNATNNDCTQAQSAIGAVTEFTEGSIDFNSSEFAFTLESTDTINVFWNLDLAPLITGDPHVVGPYHRAFDFVGQTGSSYAIISTADVQLNGEMTSFDETTTRWRGQTFITRVGVVLSNGVVLTITPGNEFDDVLTSYLSVANGELERVANNRFLIMGDASGNDAEVLVRFGGKTVEVRHCGERYFVKRRVEFPAHLDVAVDVAHAKWPTMAGIVGQLMYAANEVRDIESDEDAFLLSSIESTAFSAGSTFGASDGVTHKCIGSTVMHYHEHDRHAGDAPGVDAEHDDEDTILYNVLNELALPHDSPAARLFDSI